MTKRILFWYMQSDAEMGEVLVDKSGAGKFSAVGDRFFLLGRVTLKKRLYRRLARLHK
jgi:hypothetical protein